MTLDHVAIWTSHLEQLKDYYTQYFDGRPNEKYTNKITLFESYFISFGTGTRLELMKKPGIPENLNDTIEKQYQGLIHLAFGMESMTKVDQKCEELASAGFRIMRRPRTTGDGYYEFETLDPDNNRIEVSARLVE
jgi:lactoylglutathione lyase